MNTDEIVGENIKAGDVVSLAFSLYKDLINVNPLDLFIYERRLTRQQKVITNLKLSKSKLTHRVEQLKECNNKRWEFVRYPKNASYSEIIYSNYLKECQYRGKIRRYKSQIKNIRRKMRFTEQTIISIL